MIGTVTDTDTIAYTDTDTGTDIDTDTIIDTDTDTGTDTANVSVVTDCDGEYCGTMRRHRRFFVVD
jgi:hypothetical protein